MEKNSSEWREQDRQTEIRKAGEQGGPDAERLMADYFKATDEAKELRGDPVKHEEALETARATLRQVQDTTGVELTDDEDPWGEVDHGE